MPLQNWFILEASSGFSSLIFAWISARVLFVTWSKGHCTCDEVLRAFCRLWTLKREIKAWGFDGPSFGLFGIGPTQFNLLHSTFYGPHFLLFELEFFSPPYLHILDSNPFYNNDGKVYHAHRSGFLCSYTKWKCCVRFWFSARPRSGSLLN